MDILEQETRRMMTGPASASTKAGGRPARDRSRSPRGPLASHESPHITQLSFHTHSLLAAGAASWHQAPGTWILAPGTWHRATFGTGGGRFFLAPEDGAVPVRARSRGRLQNAPPTEAGRGLVGTGGERVTHGPEDSTGPSGLRPSPKRSNPGRPHGASASSIAPGR